MRRLFVILALLFAASLAFGQTAPPGTTLVASDSFTRANSTTTMGANWTVFNGTWGIYSDTAYLPACSAAQYCTNYYSATLPGASPYVTFKYSAWSVGQNPGAVLVNSSNAGYMVACVANSGGNCTSARLEKSANFGTTAPTILTTVTVSWAAGTAVSLYDNAGSLMVYANGTINSSFTTSDATYTPTQAGFSGYNVTGANAAYSYFEEGNLTPTGLATPTCTPATGTVNNTVSATCTIVGGATGCYTLSGTPPTAPTAGTCGSGSTAYSGAISITANSANNLQILATESGQTNSTVASYTYTFAVAAPSPVYGPSGAITFTTSSTGATMYYNNTGSTATCSSTLYSGAVYASGTNLISIIGCQSGYSNSSVVSVQPDIPVASDNFQSYYNANIGSGYSYVTAVTNGPPLQLPIDCNWTGSGPGTPCSWKAVANGATDSAVYPVEPTYRGTWISSTSYNQYDSVSYLGNYYLALQSNSSSAPPNSNWQLVVDYTDTFLSSWGYSAGAGPIQLVRTKEGYNANHGSLVYLHTGSWAAGPAVDCFTNGSWCYTLTLSSSSGTASLQRWVSGSATSIAFAGSGVTWTDGAFAELRIESGCVLRPLLNGAPIAGLSATYTDAGCTTGGQPGIAIISGGSSATVGNAMPYNFSAYNVAGTSGAYTPPNVPAPTTYTDSMSGSSWTWQPPLSTPWTTNGFSSSITIPAKPWTGPFIPEPYGAEYVAGTASTSSGQMNYQAVFGVNQWQAVSVPTLPPWKTFNWLVKLLSQNLIPGLTNGVCTANSRGSVCYDTTSYYFGENPLSTDTGICATDKDPYSCTPFVYVDKVTPWSSSTGAPQGSNAVQTLQGSTTTIMPDDSLYVQENNGWLSLYCKQNATPLPTWSSAMTITAGTTYIEGSGMVWLASTTGVAGLTQPVWPTSASWTRDPTTGIGSGTVVSDGTGAWMYYGDTCPSTTKYTQILHVYDPDLITPSAIPPNYTSPIGIGFPGLFAGCQNDSTLGVTCSSGVPFFTSFSAGTLGYGTGNPCGVNGGPSSSCVAPVTYSPSSFIP